MADAESTLPTRRHWYFIEIHWCPVCGSEKKYRERMYTTRPDEPDLRMRSVQMYDGCEGAY